MNRSIDTFFFQSSRRFLGQLTAAFCLTVLLTLPIPKIAYPASGSDSSQQESILIPEIVVTATRIPEETSRIPANVTVIKGEDIRNSSADNVPELLRMQQGVQVTDVTGNHRTYSVDLRGFGDAAPQNTLVLVDGRRITQADLSGTDWSLIPLDRIERIEIVRGGAGSVFYGDGASGGVINIITKKGGPAKFGIDVSGGSYDTYRVGAYAEGSSKKLSYNITGSYLSSDGYRLNSNTRAKDAGATLQFTPADSMQFHLSGGYHEDSTGLPGALKDSDFAAGLSRKDSIYPGNFADTRDTYAETGFEAHFWEASLFKINLSVRKRNFTSFANFTAGSFAGDTDLYTTGFSPQLLLVKAFADGYENRITLGMDYQYAKENIHNDALSFGSHTLSDFELKKTNIGVFIHEELTVMNNLEISGGYPFDRAVFDFSPGTPSEVIFNEHSASAGVNYTPAKPLRIYMNLNRSFRYPVFDEMFSFFTNTVSMLQPQSSQTCELGTQWHPLPALRINLNLFRTDTKKELIFNPNTFNNENLDSDTRREGIEAALTWQALNNVEVFATYAYFSKAEIEEGQFAGNWLPSVPQHKATGGAQITLARNWLLGLSGVYVGKRPFSGDFQNILDDQADYFIANAKVQYLWRIYKLYLNINNLTNKKYSEYGALVTYPSNQKGFYPSPGINFLLGVAAEF